MKLQVDQQVKLKPEYCKWLSEHFFDGKEVNPWATVVRTFSDRTYDLLICSVDGELYRTLWTARENFTVPRGLRHG
jgi:hypothetical protein